MVLSFDAKAVEDMRFQRIDIDKQLGGSGIGAIKVIVQDETGFIWIGAEYGLARYDGSVFTRYWANENGAGNSLLSNYINDIAFDQNGIMWVATDQGLNFYNRESDDFSLFKPDQNRRGNNRVAAIAIDMQNNLVLARDEGVSIVDASRTVVRHFHTPQYDSANHVSIRKIFIASDNTIWLGTKGGGAAILNPEKNSFRFFRHLENNPSTIISNYINCISEDQDGNIWFGAYTGGISLLKKDDTYFTNFGEDLHNPHAIGKHTIWDIYTDRSGTTWIATDHGGLSRYVPDISGFHHIRNNAYDTTSLGSNQVRKIFEDKNGDLWIGLFPNGLNFFNRASGLFHNYTHKPDDTTSISNSAILSITQDRDQTMWIGTEDGLNQFHPATNNFSHFRQRSGDANSLQANAILSLQQDSSGLLWVGTWSGGVHTFNKQTQRFRQYLHAPKNEHSLSNNFVWAINTDPAGQVWLATEGGGLNLYRPESDDFIHFRHNPNDRTTINSDYIWTMLTDSLGYLWLGTTAGLNRFDPQTYVVEQPNTQLIDQNFNKNRIRALMEDSLHRLWIGTQDNGIYIYDLTTKQFLTFTHNDELPAKYVTGFVEDSEGYVWASTTNGLLKISPTTFDFELFNSSHGLIGTNFNREANYTDNQGKVYFGAAEGLTIFNPKQLSKPTNNYPVVFTKLRIFNEDIAIGTGKSPLSKPMWLTHHVQLTHRDTMFSIDFSALEFRSGADRQYSYKLAGFNPDWINIGSNHSATFTNLSPGHYVLNVKAGSNGLWNNNTQQLTIHILPPPWQTWWAYVLYLTAIFFILSLVVYTVTRQIQLNNQLAVNQELKDLNEIKDSFLANTSHELRTPLNGIIGIADTLEDYFKGTDDFAVNHSRLIASSGRRLAHLINDILDYSKLAKRNLDLDQRPINLKSITETVFTLLAPLASNNSIQLNHRFTDATPLIYADENRLQQILVNLVGNGVKYTKHGSVELGMTEQGKWAHIYVKDTGIGIDPKQQLMIFEAFSQIQSSNSREYGGTGLGLAITKQLVELHKGDIWLDLDYKIGARFIFTMPISPNQNRSLIPHAIGRLTSPSVSDADRRTPNAIPTGYSGKPQKPRNSSDQTILVVDDDAVNRLVLAGILGIHDYQVIEADSGIQALEMLRCHPHINLIIMDVMMPHMTGFEACAVIRHNHPMHELPVVFLTAKKNVDADVKKCFEVGGNDYLSKPVSKHDLLPRVANLLRMQSIIRKLHIDLENKT